MTKERALAPKKREPRLKLKAHSREELLSQVKRMASELDRLKERSLRTRHGGESWKIDSSGYFIWGHYRKADDDVPIEVLEKLFANGHKRLKSHNDMINQLVMTNPGKSVAGQP